MKMINEPDIIDSHGRGHMNHTMSRITFKKIKSTLMSIKYLAAGPDDIHVELIKHLDAQFLKTPIL